MGNVLNFKLDDGKFGIKVHPVLHNLTRNKVGTRNRLATDILIKVVAHCLHRNNAPFYKFNAPPEKYNSAYRARDSWTEELRCSLREFRDARDAIATRIYSGGTKGLTREDAIKLRTSNALVLYRMDNNNTIWYELNPRYVNLFCEEIWNEELFIRPDGTDKTQEEIMERLNELADEMEDCGTLNTSCVYELEGDEPQQPEIGKKAALVGTKSGNPTFEVMVRGKKVLAGSRKGTKSNPTVFVPVLENHIRMHDDFDITPELRQHFLDKGFTEEELDNSVRNHISYWIGRKTMKPGWWAQWFDRFSEWNIDSKGGKIDGKGNARLNASERQTEQFRQLAEVDNYADVTD